MCIFLLIVVGIKLSQIMGDSSLILHYLDSEYSHTLLFCLFVKLLTPILYLLPPSLSPFFWAMSLLQDCCASLVI